MQAWRSHRLLLHDDDWTFPEGEDDDAVHRIRSTAADRVEDAIAYAKSSPLPDPASATSYVFA